MQIHELEEFLGGELVERHQGDAILTGRGLQIAERAALILNAARDLVDFAHQTGGVLTGTLRLGVIPTLAPYVLPGLLHKLQQRHPDLRLSLVEAQTRTLLNELTRGSVDLLLLALPVEKTDVETLELFEDRFLLAVPASDSLPERMRVTPQDVAGRNLILLEEGHCLREQALSYCAAVINDARLGFFATSLTTITQMVACGYGVTLLPEVAVGVEIRDDRIKLLRFCEPQPRRRVGLMWRRTSPCRADFIAFGQIVVEATAPPQPMRKDHAAPR